MLPEWIRYSRSAWKINLDIKETIDLRAISNRACNERNVSGQYCGNSFWNNCLRSLSPILRYCVLRLPFRTGHIID